MVPLTPLQLALIITWGVVLTTEHTGVRLNPLPTLHDIGVTLEMVESAGKLNYILH